MAKELPDANRQLPLEWHIPEHLPCQYATNIVAQHTKHEFILSFFRASPPIILGSPKSAEEQIRRLESVRAECVARVIVAPGRMAEFVEVLQSNLAHYLSEEEEE